MLTKNSNVRPLFRAVFCFAGFAALAFLYGQGEVIEGARQIPVAFDTDVVVVGGTTVGVAAAVAAAEAGARVTLVAPRPYLGEDRCATYRIFFDPKLSSDDPLAKALLKDPAAEHGLRFSYKADLPSMEKHVDSEPPGMLTDGQWGTAFTQSVQYNGDVTITAELKEATVLREVRVMLFQASKNFEVAEIALSTSVDGETWSPGPAMLNTKAGKGNYVEEPLTLRAPVEVRARYVRFKVKRNEGSRRVLLGELQIFAQETMTTEKKGMRPIPPMQIKRVLDDALITAGVSFLYSSPVTDILRDADGAPAGVVVANRAGRQAIRAKAIVDATYRGVAARLAGAEFTAYPAGVHEFKRIVVGGEPVAHPRVTSRLIRLDPPLGGKSPATYGSDGFGSVVSRKNIPMTRSHDCAIEYTVSVPMKDASFASFAEAEQLARDWTFHLGQLDESEVLFEVPPDHVIGASTEKRGGTEVDSLSEGVFQPKNVQALYVVGPSADVPRPVASRLTELLPGIEAGRTVGLLAARHSLARPALGKVSLPGNGSELTGKGEVREELTGLSPRLKPTAYIEVDARRLPVLGQYDVVVAGGGTAGAPAAIGAARHGGKTLVFDYLHGLGGVGTTGLIGIYCAGYRKGFTAEVDQGIRDIGSPSYIVAKMEWWRSQARKAGADIWFGVLGCGAFVEDGQVKGVVVATPQGRGVVLAGAIVDGTGNADIAAAAGATTRFVGSDTIAMQGAGLPQREIGASYINTDWTYVDENDVLDVQNAFIQAKKRYGGAFDLGQLVDTRERRRILGDYTLDPLDIINKRTFPDTIGMSQGGKLDKHGYTVHPYYFINNHRGGISYTPYRCLIPRGLEGILVVGLALSAHRDAIPSIRMQPCMQNLGYAAGRAASIAAAEHAGKVRSVDIRVLQKHLVEIGSLTPEVLTHTDSFPPSSDAVAAAVKQLGEKNYEKLGIIMAAGEEALPVLRSAYHAAGTPEGKLRCAHVLGMMGDATGEDTLVEAVSSAKSMGDENISRYFPCITWVDSYIIALGRSGSRKALDVALEKLAVLRSQGGRTSHYRAVCDALETIGDPRAAQPLSELLAGVLEKNRPPRLVTAEDAAQGKSRNKVGQRELIIARVLYRCGDCQGLGERVLRMYADDIRSVYARHARAVLKLKPGEPTRPRGWAGD